MDVSFVLTAHLIERRDYKVCEVWDGSRLVGVVYPHQDGIHIVSKYLNGTEPTGLPAPGILVKLNGRGSADA